MEQRPVPRPAPGDVLVRVSSVGVCGSDTHYYRHGRIGSFVVEAPLVLGHEAAGTIVGVGDAVDASRIGQRVSIEPQRPDPESAETRRGDYNLCPHMRFYGTPPIDGALCDYVTIGAEFAHPVPDSVSDDAAALCEPLSVGIAALRKAGIGEGARVLVAGAGPIGIVVVQLARAYGAERDRRVRSRRIAPRAGPDQSARRSRSIPRHDRARDCDVDAFIDASGAPAAVTAGIHALRPAGTAVLVGSGAESMDLPTQLIQNRELTLTGVFRYANTWPTAIALVESRPGRSGLDGHCAIPAREGRPEALDSDRTPGSVKTVVAVS